ncbi:MAG: virulence RhuM family protein [Bacteroidetes bacterium]|nr:virulence RhuM family protein [Bacteroidota bacterium]
MASEILIYKNEIGKTEINVRLEHQDVWLNQNQLAELYQTTKQNISLHLANIYKEGELIEYSTVKEYLTVQEEGSRSVNRSVKFYNLDAIISVGYRIKSTIATQFRIWATARLKEYLIKGFILDDQRLMEAKNDYFDELVERVQNIRTSEKVFYRKVCEIYATSADYDASSKVTQDFFSTVQNKFHWAIHAHTAAELVIKRANANVRNMGLTSWSGSKIKRTDVTIAKNYLSEDELKQLNLLVSQYLDFAELQAMQRKAMYMADWINKLHGFLTLNEREILDHKGTISHSIAEQHALKEFDKFKKQLESSEADALDKAVKKLT